MHSPAAASTASLVSSLSFPIKDRRFTPIFHLQEARLRRPDRVRTDPFSPMNTNPAANLGRLPLRAGIRALLPGQAPTGHQNPPGHPNRTWSMPEWPRTPHHPAEIHDISATSGDRCAGAFLTGGPRSDPP